MHFKFEWFAIPKHTNAARSTANFGFGFFAMLRKRTPKYSRPMRLIPNSQHLLWMKVSSTPSPTASTRCSFSKKMPSVNP